MRGINRALFVGLAALALSAASLPAAHAATNACTANDIISADNGCPASGPCSITKVFNVVNPACDFDFSGRDVTIAGSGELRIDGNMVTFTTADFKLTGGQIDGSTSGIGGFFRVNAIGNIFVGFQPTGKVLVNGGTRGGNIVLEATGNVTVNGQLKANNDQVIADGGNITLRAGGNVVIGSSSTVDPKGGSQASGGFLDIVAGGSVITNALLDVGGGEGGGLSVISGASITINQRVVATGSGDAGSGGCVDLIAGTGVEINDQIQNQGTGSAILSGGGCGGGVFVSADFGDITVRDEINVKSGPPDGGGGCLELFSVGSINIESTATLISDGGGGDSCGGEIALDANYDITVDGPISALGGDAGGEIVIEAGRHTTINATAELNARGDVAGSFGGAVTLEAGFNTTGTLVIASPIDVGAPACDSFGFCSLAGDVDFLACNVFIAAGVHIDAHAGGSEGSGGTVFGLARESLFSLGTMDATGGTTALDGSVTLIHKIGAAPTIAGAITPAADVSGRPACTGGGGDAPNCLLPCPPCGNGVVEFPEACDTVGTPVSCDGCSAFCTLENCDDSDICSEDSCDPVLGCRHVAIPEAEVTVCRPAAGPCDRAESCVAGRCPTDQFESSIRICRTSTGACDPAERCTGSSITCPTDALAPSGTVCRAAIGDCDVEEICNGSTAACPPNAIEPAGTLCRPAAGNCDLEETCNGSSPACPADAREPAGTPCRTATGPCDLEETCTGSASACPADSLASAGTVCRASGGDCDPAETCTGTTAPCPADVLATAGTVCRAATGSCDAEESCDGSTATCPGDTLEPAGTVCRSKADACDAEETCSGTDPTCPGNAFEPDGAACDDGDTCTIDDTCDGAGVCTGDPSACGDGTVQSACNEQCDDNNTAGGDGCSATCTVEPCFVCANEPSVCSPDTGAECDDGDVCTHEDACSGSGICEGEARPRTGCRQPVQSAKSLLKLKDKDVDRGDQVLFKWSKGAAVQLSELGDPTSSTDYTLCVYDELAGSPTRVLKLTAPAAALCKNSRPCWKPNRKGFKYADGDTSRGGLQKMQLAAGADGKAKVQVKAKGTNLTLPTLALDQDATVTAQVVGSNGFCVEAEFSAPATVNSPDQFKDKAD